MVMLSSFEIPPEDGRAYQKLASVPPANAQWDAKVSAESRPRQPSNRSLTTLPPCVSRTALPISSSSTGLPASLSQKAERKLNRSEEHTSELQSLMSISYAVLGLKKKTK